ncbi:MAG: DUF4398 domain-containing protein [Proteobacteria bacterium]|nr:DUF4398 domain-containing protein [Pseudomonadota bacterium]
MVNFRKHPSFHFSLPHGPSNGQLGRYKMKIWKFSKISLPSISLYALFMLISACSSTEKPTQEMIFANAAMKAAERSLAEKRAPDLFRRAEQAHWRAQRYYLARDFEEAKKSAELTRRLAEKAEFSAELKAAEEDEFYE